MPPATSPDLSNRSVTIAELMLLLQERADGERCVLAFDGDGTLWSGDVSDDVFLGACESDWLLPGVRPVVAAVLSQHGLSTDGTTSELTYRIFEAEKAGKLDERLLFEAMTWCYAGRSVDELSAYSEKVLSAKGIDSRVRAGYRPLLDWARAAGHTCLIVTASPWPIVRVAASRLGFGDDQIIASCPVESKDGVIGTALAAPLPYREQKVQRLAERRNNMRLLAAFGDSLFDVELLRSAEIRVAVNPKPALLRELDSLEHAFVLRF